MRHAQMFMHQLQSRLHTHLEWVYWAAVEFHAKNESP